MRRTQTNAMLLWLKHKGKFNECWITILFTFLVIWLGQWLLLWWYVFIFIYALQFDVVFIFSSVVFCHYIENVSSRLNALCVWPDTTSVFVLFISTKTFHVSHPIPPGKILHVAMNFQLFVAWPKLRMFCCWTYHLYYSLHSSSIHMLFFDAFKFRIVVSYTYRSSNSSLRIVFVQCQKIADIFVSNFIDSISSNTFSRSIVEKRVNERERERDEKERKVIQKEDNIKRRLLLHFEDKVFVRSGE